jgi:dipeptidyl aminopeptidase/acylaminoacyl peptidase
VPRPTAELSATDPLAGLTIDDLSQRSYGGSGIVLLEVVETEPEYTQYAMVYPSDGLKITGLVNLPAGEGPFPVVIVNHGYRRPAEYRPGMDSWRIAERLARQGYIALMPDYRNYAGSDKGPNPFHIGYAIDVMNLIAQVDSLPAALPDRIGLIGHSMGGELCMWPMVIMDDVRAVVLYASTSGDVARNWAHARQHWDRQTMDALALAYGSPDDHPEMFAAMSPVNYLDRVRMPVLIHHGMQDEWVPYAWSAELAGLMEEAGANVTFYSYPGGRHALIGDDYEALMTRTLDFFDEHVRGVGAEAEIP